MDASGLSSRVVRYVRLYLFNLTPISRSRQDAGDAMEDDELPSPYRQDLQSLLNYIDIRDT